MHVSDIFAFKVYNWIISCPMGPILDSKFIKNGLLWALNKLHEKPQYFGLFSDYPHKNGPKISHMNCRRLKFCLRRANTFLNIWSIFQYSSLQKIISEISRIINHCEEFVLKWRPEMELYLRIWFLFLWETKKVISIFL